MMSLYRLLFVGFMVIAGCADTNSSVQADMPKGVIKLSANQDGSGKSCALEIKEITGPQYFHMADTSCKSDEARFFMLENVPSATEIRFDNYGCPEGDTGWYFKIKTIVHPTTTRRVNLRELQGSAVGSIVVKGVVLIDEHDGDKYSDGKLSCVVVWRSAQP